MCTTPEPAKSMKPRARRLPGPDWSSRHLGISWNFIAHRIHGAGIYADIRGILMGSMLPYTLRVQAAVDPNLPRRRFHKPNPSHAFLYPMPSLCAAPKPKQKGTKVASTRLLLQMITRAGELHQMLILANNIPGGSGDVLEVGCGKIHGGISGQVMFWRWGVGRFMEGYLVYLALYPWMSSKWGLWTARVFQALCLRHGACKSAVSSFHSCRSMPLAWGFQPWHGLIPSALCLYHGACKSAVASFHS